MKQVSLLDRIQPFVQRRLSFGLFGVLALSLLVFVQSSPSAAQALPNVGALLTKAQQQGSVRVIVGLRMGFQPEGNLPVRAQQTQRVAIAQAQNSVRNQLASYNVRSVHPFAYIPYLALEADAGALAFLASSPQIASITEDVPRRPTLAESSVLVGATNAWASGFTGAGQVVAILDTGVDNAHSFLAGKVVSEACYSTNDSGWGSSSVCPGGVTESTAPGSGVPCSPTIAGCWHGTHVAGIAAGRGASFSGIAKDANLIAIQVFSNFSGSALSWDSDQIKGLERVYALRGTFNIAAVNLSLGGGRQYAYCDSIMPAYKTAVDNLRSVGIATIIASGNDYYSDSLNEPACLSNVISVGSTRDGGAGGTPADTVSDFSNSAFFLTLLAPGQVIYASMPGGGFGNSSGTSMATPHVAGAWAILKGKTPAATVEQILSALTSTGVPVYDTRNGITKPRIQIDAALNALNSPPSTPQSIYLPFVSKNSSALGSWSAIVSTDFEGDFPGPWNVIDGNGTTGGDYRWGKRNCRAYAGSFSGWGVGAGANGGALACGSHYPDNAEAWMTYGPFSLTNTAAAELRARIWTQTEAGYDGVCLLASLNNTNFYGTCYSGNSNWVERVLDLSAVPSLGNVLGQSNVWIAIVFASDISINYPEGGYVDNIELRRCPSGASCPSSSSSSAAGQATPAMRVLRK